MPSIFLAIVIICLMAALLVYGFKPYDYGGNIKRFNKAGKAGARRSKSTDTDWRSVRVRPGKISCKRVAAITDQTFLSKDAPSLPLENCTTKDCRCHYTFLDDRRGGEDRRIEFGRTGEFLPAYGGERRWAEGRRDVDLTI